jgi:nucleoside-diphosphate-sugar epimerase
MKTLIIGGTGLISTAITRLMLERGDDVTLYNRGVTQAYIPGGARIITGNRKDFPAFERQVEEAGCFDCVIDMVCFEPDEAASLILAVSGRTDHLIFCSTVDVYTKPAARYPIREDEPRHPDPGFSYAYNKALCENLLLDAEASGAFPLTIIRPAYTYGEGRGLLHAFRGRTTMLDRIRRGLPIVVHGDGQSLWVSCHRDDVARAFVAAADTPVARGRQYHVTGEEWLTWNQYFAGIAEAMGVPTPELVHIPTDLLAQALPVQAHWCDVNFQYDNIFDNAAAHADLGFRYTVPWVEGARRVIEWLDAHGGIEPAEADPLMDRIIAAWRRKSAAMVADLADLREEA